MATYSGGRADLLDRSLAATFAQTRLPDQVVLVLDGPIGDEQEGVVSRYQRDGRIKQMDVVRLPKNQGFGAALSVGTRYCTGDWIMRMDDDDMSYADRTEIQLDYLLRHPEVDLLGAWAKEYSETTPGLRMKSCPTTHDGLVRSLRWRNVLCHPSIMVRATTLREVGGYRGKFPLLEDWDLFARLVMSGARLAVVPKALVCMRAGTDQAARRGGFRYVISETKFRAFLLSIGFIGLGQFAVTTTAYTLFRLIGAQARSLMYQFVRTPVSSEQE